MTGKGPLSTASRRQVMGVLAGGGIGYLASNIGDPLSSASASNDCCCDCCSTLTPATTSASGETATETQTKTSSGTTTETSSNDGSELSVKPHPETNNPVLTAADFEGVGDMSGVRFVADPFIWYRDGTYFLFCEVVADGQVTIGYATSNNGLSWTAAGEARPARYFSYPYVFEDNGTLYMMPNMTINPGGSIYLYSESDFPLFHDRERLFEAFKGTGYGDPTPFKPAWADEWYIFLADHINSGFQTLLYRSNSSRITDASWTEHPSSPVSTDERYSRPAGRAITNTNSVDIPMMDTSQTDGKAVLYRRITELSPTAFRWESLGETIIGPTGSGWNANGMHHIDYRPKRPGSPEIVAVDSLNADGEYSIGIYTIE